MAGIIGMGRIGTHLLRWMSGFGRIRLLVIMSSLIVSRVRIFAGWVRRVFKVEKMCQKGFMKWEFSQLSSC